MELKLRDQLDRKPVDEIVHSSRLGELEEKKRQIEQLAAMLNIKLD